MIKRYLAKLIANIASLGLSIGTLYLLPRALGGSDFGSFDLVFSHITSTAGLLLLGVPNAISVWYSRQHDDQIRGQAASSVTLAALFIAALVISVFVAFLIATDRFNIIWPDVSASVVGYATSFALVTTIWQIILGLADSTHLTVKIEFLKVLQMLAKLGLFAAMFALGLLNLASSSVIQIALQAALLVATWIMIQKTVKYPLFSVAGLRHSGEFLKYVWVVSAPLIIYNITGYLHKIADRWILQYYGGADAQAQLVLSTKTAAISFAFSAAMTPLLLREIALFHHRKDVKKVRRLFNQSKTLIAITTCLAAFFSIHADFFAKFFGGDEIVGAFLPMAIMAFSPIHQTLSQFGGAIALATDRVKMSSYVNSIFSILAIPIGWFLIGPAFDSFHFQWDRSSVLALKIIVIQAVQTNVILFFNCRALKSSFRSWVVFQVQCVLICLGLGIASARIVQLIPLQASISAPNFASFFSVVLSFGFYSVFVVIVWYLYPNFVGGIPLNRFSKLIYERIEKVTR